MAIFESAWRALSAAAIVLPLLALASCQGPIEFTFDRPDEPQEVELVDLITGPLDRVSALDVVQGRRQSAPRAVRVDQTGEWDIAFAILEGEPVWLPRGYFDAFEPTSGIAVLDRGFDEVVNAPSDRDLYEDDDPVPISTDRVYVVRSRNDPALSLPCHVFAKIEVLSIEGDPARARIRYLWNPNCDLRNLTPGPG